MRLGPLEPLRGRRVVVFHPRWIYFLTRFGLVQAAVLEDRPGIPPSPRHLVHVISQMKADGIKVILLEPWNDRKLADRVADEAGAMVLVLRPWWAASRGSTRISARSTTTCGPWPTPSGSVDAT
jgi:ABC-type Zn uptake system ZnuABC Zn-binding protein ZnuA